MTLAAVAQHDRLDQRGPPKIVDMIERRTGRDQHSHDFDVTEVRSRNQCGALIGAGNVVGLATTVKRDPEHLHVVGDGGNRDDVVLLRFKSIWIGAKAYQDACGILLAHENGDVKRRAAVAVARIDRRASTYQALDFAGIASGGRGVQAAIGRYFGRARWDLRRSGSR